MKKFITLLGILILAGGGLSICAWNSKQSFTNPKWQRVLREQPIEEGNNTPTYKDIEVAQNKCNIPKFSSDKDVWGVEDFWATPNEFYQKNAGDCEDFAICKYYALRKAGFKPKDLEILIGRENILQADHAVILVKFGREKFILDSVHKEIIMAQDYLYKNFTPIYGLNEESATIY